MKKLMILHGILVLLLVVLLGACAAEGGELPVTVPPPRVAMPGITTVPDRLFNDGDITITLSTATADAIIFYTLDGTPPTSASMRFEDVIILGIADTDANDHVTLRVVGTRPGFDNSVINNRNFHIAAREPFGNHSGTGFGVADGYYGSIRVDLTLEYGFITEVEIQDGYAYTDPETREDGLWYMARNPAHEFMMVMNALNFDVMSGATYSSIAIQTAAQEALAMITGE